MPPIQVAISFDTTGSMSRALEEVRTRITEMIRLLKRDIPGVTLSIIAHGDYCDADIYVTKHIDFTDNEDKLVSFVRDVKNTGGGDAPECYELVLRLVRTQLSWKERSQKMLVVIGDAYPHPPEDPQNKDNIDWEQEARLLAGMPMRIYGAQINDDRRSTEFFQKLTRMTGGSHLQLTEFRVLSDVIMAVCYRATGTAKLKSWEEKVRAQYAPKPLHKDLEEAFAVLHRPLAVPTVPAKKKKPPSPYTYRGKDISFFWGVKIVPSEPLSWEVPAEEHSVHKLQLKLAVLGSEAKAHEANVVEMESTDFADNKITQPIVHMIGGKDSMASLDLSFNSPVTFQLVSGSGPVYLSGQHVARALPEEDEEGETDGASTDEVTVESSPATARSSASEMAEVTDESPPATPRSSADERAEVTDGSSPATPDDSDDPGDEASAAIYIQREEVPQGSEERSEPTGPDRSEVFERDLQDTFEAVSRIFGTASEARRSPPDSKPPQCKTS